MLTRYDDIRAALADNRLVFHFPGAPIDDGSTDTAGILFLMNGPRHVRLRGAVARALSARRVAALRPAVERLAGARLAALRAAGPPADLVRDYAVPLAVDTLSELLGIDIADRPDFAGWAAVLTALMAGFVPAAQSLGLGALRLLRDPASAAAFRTDPARFPAVVDELLRLDPSGAATTDRPMRTTEDVEIGGRTIRRGEIVVAPFGAANRDPAHFHDPDRFDPARSSNPHLTFAPGPHHCLGAALTRMQLEVGLTTLLVGLPDLTLATHLDELRWRTGLMGERNLVALPITWHAAG